MRKSIVTTYTFWCCCCGKEFWTGVDLDVAAERGWTVMLPLGLAVGPLCSEAGRLPPLEEGDEWSEDTVPAGSGAEVASC